MQDDEHDDGGRDGEGDGGRDRDGGRDGDGDGDAYADGDGDFQSTRSQLRTHTCIENVFCIRC